ncbi:MAG TPA: hypothetical protein VN329_12175, partial [Roseomonas sp.]|nr:hypothetical protein [Roseomonas sp.]
AIAAAPAAPVIAAAEPARPQQPVAPRPAPQARVAAAPRPAPTPVQPALHVERRVSQPPQPQTVAATMPRPAPASSLGFSSLGSGGAPSLAPPVPIARASAATLPPGMAR